MNPYRLMIPALGLALVLCLALSAAAADPSLESFDQKVSYFLGKEIGNSFKDLPASLDMDLFIRGLTDGLQNRPGLLKPEEMDAVKSELAQKVKADQERKQAALSEKNRLEEVAFFAKNSQDKDVVTTASGLQYKILQEGHGATPQHGDRVTVNYRGTLLDGTEFDSSYQHGQPTTFQVDRVIAGWTEALQLMKVGGKYRLFVPSKLAYGSRGAGSQIGPNAALIFDVDLLDIQK